MVTELKFVRHQWDVPACWLIAGSYQKVKRHFTMSDLISFAAMQADFADGLATLCPADDASARSLLR